MRINSNQNTRLEKFIALTIAFFLHILFDILFGADIGECSGYRMAFAIRKDCCLLTSCKPWRSYFMSLNFSFLFCKMRITMTGHRKTMEPGAMPFSISPSPTGVFLHFSNKLLVLKFWPQGLRTR